MSGLNKFLKLIPKRLESNESYTINSDILDKVTIINDLQDVRIKDSQTGTQVVFLVNKSNIVYGFMAYGTTGYAQAPYDIVSSCISTLCFHTVNTIKVFTNDKIEVKSESEFSLFAVVLPNLKYSNGSDLSKTLLKSMIMTMSDVQNQYEKHLKIYIKFD